MIEQYPTGLKSTTVYHCPSGRILGPPLEMLVSAERAAPWPSVTVSALSPVFHPSPKRLPPWLLRVCPLTMGTPTMDSFQSKARLGCPCQAGSPAPPAAPWGKTGTFSSPGADVTPLPRLEGPAGLASHSHLCIPGMPVPSVRPSAGLQNTSFLTHPSRQLPLCSILCPLSHY